MPTVTVDQRRLPLGAALPVTAVRGTATVPRPRPPVRSRLAYLPALDGLRGAAVVAVLVFHTWAAALPGGYIGVDLFFVLSGYLITSLLLRERALTGSISLARFFGRRALRLLPPLMPVLAACTLYAVLLPGAPLAEATLKGVWATIGYASSWLYAYGVGLGWLSHSWSLSVEEQFYALWPPILVLLLLWGSRRVALAACILGVGAVVEARTLMAVHGVPWERLYCGFDTRADALLIGAALALAADLGLLRRVRREVIWGVALVGLAVLAWAALRVADPGRLAGPGFTLIDLCAAALIAAVAIRPAPVLVRVLQTSPLVGMGRISYAMYLWHLPIYGYLVASGAVLPAPATLVVVLGMTWLMATLSYELIEAPCATLRRRLGRAERVRV
jgi:peptidoglycan/LPS O-acetylase OafA/YrhL